MSANNEPQPGEPVEDLATLLGLTLPGIPAPTRLPRMPAPRATSCWPGLPERPATPPKARPVVDLDL